MDQSSRLLFDQSFISKPNSTLRRKLINHAISEIGEGHIPYPEQRRPRILRDVVQLLFHFPSLGLMRGRFQKGQPVVLVINGNIPIFYKGHPYIIPIKIWVPLGYPMDSPKVRVVVEDQETVSIKLPHPHVDAGAGGLVNVPYMQAWTEAHSERTLTGLVINMCECFSVNPPLRKRAMPPPAPESTFPIPQPPQEQERHEEERRWQRPEQERHEQVMQERERQEEGKRCRGKRGRGWACGLL